jgi:membrane protease YdiL (CAAX protease family)
VPELLFVVLVVAVTPAIVEEFLFRGLVQGCFARSTSPGRAAIWAGLIFGVFHFNPFSVVPLIALGIFFGMLRYRSQSMILAMTIHFLNNGLAVVVTHFNIDDKLVAGADKGVEANLLMLLTQLVLGLTLFGLTFSWYWRLTKEPST